MTESTKEQIQAALDWFNKANWDERVPEIHTIRAVLQSALGQHSQSLIKTFEGQLTIDDVKVINKEWGKK